MSLVAYVFLVAVGLVVWALLSSRFPRFGFLANGAAVVYAILTPPLASIGFGWTVLGFIAVGFGLLASFGGLLEQHQRAAEAAQLPRARIARN